MVRIDVCKHLLAASVPFAIVVNGIASPHNSCYHGRATSKRAGAAPPPQEPGKRLLWSLAELVRCDRFPVALICDLSSSLLLLQQPECPHVLLFDEPTADVAPGMRTDVRRLLRASPSITVLMSAGVPEFAAMPAFVRLFFERHPTAELKTVACSRLPMSITALDAEGRVWAPHHFGVPVEAIVADSHLMRFYSPRVLLELAEQEGSLSFEDLLSYTALREACMRLLRTKEAATALASASTMRDAVDDPVRLEHACSKHAWRLPGASLIILDAVELFVAQVLAPMLQDLPSLRRVLKADLKRAALPLATSLHVGRHQRGDRGDRGDAASAFEAHASDLVADAQLWPRAAVMNTLEHLKKYAPPGVAKGGFPMQWLRSPMLIPAAVMETSSEVIVEAALCGLLPFGVGDSLFETAAQVLAEGAQQSFAAADIGLIYGINFPVERVIVACKELGYLEMKQLCGRAGRTGRAAKAEVLFMDRKGLRTAMMPPDEATLLASAAANFAVGG